MVNKLSPLAGPVDASGEPVEHESGCKSHFENMLGGALKCNCEALRAAVRESRAAAAVPSSPAQEALIAALPNVIHLLRLAELPETANDLQTRLDALALQPSSPVADVEVIVNGQPVVVTAGTVRAVIEEAIRRSGQIGAPVAQWELRTTEGDIIPHNLTDGTDYELTPGRRLWLNLGAPSSPVAGSIHRLIEQWRASADWMMGSTKPDEWQRGGSGYLRKCADELEAALSAPSPSAGAAQEQE